MYARRDDVTALIAAVREEEHAILAALREQWVLKERAEREAYRKAAGLAVERVKPRRPGRPVPRNSTPRQPTPRR
jgi:hypothetical protein